MNGFGFWILEINRCWDHIPKPPQQCNSSNRCSVAIRVAQEPQEAGRLSQGTICHLLGLYVEEASCISRAGPHLSSPLSTHSLHLDFRKIEKRGSGSSG